jgi:cytochrome c5
VPQQVTTYEGSIRDPARERVRRPFAAIVAQARAVIGKRVYAVTCQACGAEQETTERGQLCSSCGEALVWPV